MGWQIFLIPRSPVTDDTYEVCEMQGLIAEWDGSFGAILTDCGERVPFTFITFKMLGFDLEPKIGNRVHFYATQKVTVSYDIKQVRVVVPQEPDPKALARLKKLNRALLQERDPDDLSLKVQELTGTVESFDCKKGTGFLRTDDGDRIHLDNNYLGSKNCKGLKAGNTVQCKAVRVRDHWQAASILSVTPPSPPCKRS